jgi:hypothetical protein
MRTPHPHCEDDGATRETDETQDYKQPTIADGINNRYSDKGSDAQKDISHHIDLPFSLPVA